MSRLHPSRPATLIVALALASAPAAGAEDEVTFPDSHAGRRAAAFFEAFNTRDPDAMRAFESSHRAAAALATRPIDDRITQYKELLAQFGRLEAKRLEEDSKGQVTVVAKATASGDWFRMRFELEEASPHKLVAVYIEGPCDPNVDPTSAALDADARLEVIDAIIATLSEAYVFPEKAEAMEAALRKQVADGDYADVSSPQRLAQRLTRDLQEVCHDKHLRVTVETRRDGNPIQRWTRRGRERRNNYGLEQVAVLAGNVGYVKLNMFHPGRQAQETAAAAMAFLRNCDALIFDLRANGGGSPEMINFLSGYLFDQKVHLNSFYNRREDRTTHKYSRTDVPGHKFGEELPVYVLTSRRTFSGAEEFTYNLKNLKRATIVGETTGGGAHPVFGQSLPHGFSITVPFARAINPITKTNWEGVGVTPHIETSADGALDAALEHARRAAAKKETARAP